MNQQTLTVVSNRPLTASVFEMKLRGDTSAFTRPGQFLNLRLDGLYLRRPFSICDTVGDLITVIYKVVGRGTETMTALPVGAELDALCGLGNGFDPDPEADLVPAGGRRQADDLLLRLRRKAAGTEVLQPPARCLSQMR